MGPGPVGWGMPILRATSTLVRACLNEGLGSPGVANTTPYLRGQLRDVGLGQLAKTPLSPLVSGSWGECAEILANLQRHIKNQMHPLVETHTKAVDSDDVARSLAAHNQLVNEFVHGVVFNMGEGRADMAAVHRGGPRKI